MADPFTGMADVFLAAFGGQVTYRARGATGDRAIRGIVEEAGIVVTVSDGIPVESVQPVCSISAADLPAQPRHGDTISSGGRTYTVAGVEDDGRGMLRLILKRA